MNFDIINNILIFLIIEIFLVIAIKKLILIVATNDHIEPTI